MLRHVWRETWIGNTFSVLLSDEYLSFMDNTQTLHEFQLKNIEGAP